MPRALTVQPLSPTARVNQGARPCAITRRLPDLEKGENRKQPQSANDCPATEELIAEKDVDQKSGLNGKGNSTARKLAAGVLGLKLVLLYLHQSL